ncbi:MAG TPA: glycosyltransferase family 2 protein [Thermoplasmata archaeon]|nr:glycosyltransferase family 2 protein [Thermoplasmata archaeon]
MGAIKNVVRTSLSIVLPALNEEAGIEAVMKRIPQTILRGRGLSWSVNLLDGHSTDRTRAVASGLGAEVFIQSGRGKGAAFREFIPSIREDVTVLLDSDGTYPPEAIPELLEALGGDRPVVLGSRLLGSIDAGAMSNANYLGNRLLSLFATIVFRTHISDLCSGMWAFESDRLKSLDLSANGFDLEADIFAECALRRIPIAEIPIRYERRIGRPKLRFSAGFKIAFRLLVKRLRARDRLALEDAVSPAPWTGPAEGTN